MNVKAKKMLSLVLAFVMVLGMLPATVFATNEAGRFVDVPAGAWFSDAVQYVSDNGLMVGVDDNHFAPDGLTTRGMVVTVLHRMEGAPSAEAAGFTDVEAGMWYTEAVLWAQANGIVEGYGDGTFHPNASMTREQMMAVFYRYSQYKGYDVSDTMSLGAFTDSIKIQSYAEDAMAWAVAVGLIKGFPDGTIRPQADSNRAQLATVLMRFADVNQIPDDGNDEDDTEITEDDASILSASQYEVVANSTTVVTFYVNSTLTVPYFELYVNDSSTGMYLYDNGDYSNCGDDIPNDGCYTTTITVDYNIESDYSFYAVATIGGNKVQTNIIDVFVYYELTDEELDEMEVVDAHIQHIINKTQEENPDASVETLNELLRQNILAYLHELELEGLIYGIVDDPENYLITFRFANGINGGVQYYDPHHISIPVEEGQPSNQTSIIESSRATVANSTITPNVSIDVDYITYKERALLLCYENFQSGWDGASLEDGTSNLANSLSGIGFEVDARYSVTVSDFLNMQDYDYIHVACHGSYYTLWTSPFTNEKTPVICTPESATKATKKAYSADLKKDRIVVVNGNYWIRPSFFDFHYEETPLKANLVALGCCKGAFTDHLCESFVNAGAGAVLGYSDTVYTAYDYYMSADILNELYQGHTVSQALTHAQNTYGTDDLVWGAEQRDNGNTNFNTLKSERAECRLFGNSSQKLHQSLTNGNFDNPLDILIGNLLFWKKYGDARSIFRLAGLEAKSAPKMAIISSGFGSMGSETTSSIYQTFLVSGDVSTIEFSYNVVSEEPMEYVGSQYNDFVQVDLLDTDGNILETLAYESVNTSTWYPIDGINFPGGDDTTYHTRWKKITSNVLSKYRGQLIVLRFIVQDAGDSVYDTAMLIDSVRVH